jgi:hypothetical protein
MNNTAQVEASIEVFVSAMDASERKATSSGTSTSSHHVHSHTDVKDYRGTVVLQFYTTQKKTSLGGFLSREEKVYWERWAIPLHVTKPKGGSGRYTPFDFT